MRILILTQYYPPETGAAQNRLSDLSLRLATAGHAVIVLTALPSYPTGEIFKGYSGRFLMTEVRNNIQIIRTWAFVTKRHGFLWRIANYLSFSIIALFMGPFKVGGIDVVFVESPPLSLAVSGFVFSKLKQAKLVLNISDLWPASAVALGMLSNRWVIRWVTRMEEGLYRRANLVTGQTQGIIESIQTRCPEATSLLLTNGVSPEFLANVDVAQAARERTRKDLGFGTRLIAAYTGVHGFAQGLDTILCAAEILKEFDDIQFLFVGDGPDKARLCTTTVDKRLRNVVFLETVPSSRMPEILAAIDIALVPLKRHDLFKGALPSKLFEAMGAGVPVLVGIDGEARSLVESSGGGLTVEPENPDQLARAVLRLYREPALRQRLGRRGRAYVHEFHNRRKIAEALEGALLCITSGKDKAGGGASLRTETGPPKAEVAGFNYKK